jgi:hypothetical protein
MHAVVAREGREPHVRNDEPLRGEIVLVVLLLPGRLGDHGICARLQVADRLVDRDGGGDFGIELGHHVQFARVHLDALRLLELLDVVARQLAVHVALGQFGGQ